LAFVLADDIRAITALPVYVDADGYTSTMELVVEPASTDSAPEVRDVLPTMRRLPATDMPPPPTVRPPELTDRDPAEVA